MARSDIVILPLAASDEADWRRLWTGYLAFYETSVPEEVYATTWARLLSGADSEFHGLIARGGDGAALGITHYLFHRHCWSVADVVYLQDLFVAPEIRGGGVGRALIERVYAEADRAGAANVYWLTQTFNATARALYDRIAKETPFIKYARN
jgi:GNAT superfamily N-acetyltransferase